MQHVNIGHIKELWSGLNSHSCFYFCTNKKWVTSRATWELEAIRATWDLERAEDRTREKNMHQALDPVDQVDLHVSVDKFLFKYRSIL